MEDILAIFFRWVHIVSAITLLGGVIYARLVMTPSLAVLNPGARESFVTESAARFRVWLLGAMGAILASGLYNLLTKAAVPKGYHMVFGIKMLLALHIFAVGILLARSGVSAEKRSRWMTGVVLSGLLVAVLSAYLRRLTQ